MVQTQNPKYIPKPYEQATSLGQKVQVDVKVVPKSCIVGKANELGQKLYQYTAIHQKIRPYTPRHNGKVGRSHRRDNEYFYSLNKFASLEDFKQKLADWNNFSNHLPMRPLGNKSPVEILSSFL